MSPSVRPGVYLVAAALLFVSVGCGSASFIGRRYDNFTSYYNTFYNAEQYYKNGVQAMESSEEPIDRMQYTGIFGAPPRSGGNVNFREAIDRSTDILIEHPRSKWVDDALVLIGKSYFYQENYVGAEQKFREVMAFESSLEDEARIWLARTLMAVRSYEAAEQHLASSLERENVSRRSQAQLRLALGELFVKQEAFDKAAEALAASLPDVRDKEFRAKGAFLLGQVYETLARYEEAVAAYDQARKERPPYELDYAASLSMVRVQGVHLDGEAALEALRRMDRDDKHYDRRPELAYVRGRIYQAQGLFLDALATYDRILYEEESRSQTVRGLTHYALAELYRDAFRDYPLAAAHFDTARSALSSFSASKSGSAAHYAPEAVTDAEELADVFGGFSEVRARVVRMDSLLVLGRLPEEEFDERIRAMQEQKAKELEEERRRTEQLQAERGFQDAASRTGALGGGGSSNAANIGEAGFLHHRDRTRVQEARINFVSRWGERPHVPGWRRMEAVSLALSAREERDADQEGGAPDGGMGDMDLFSLPIIDVSDVPRDSLSQAEMEAERALARYELGNALFLSMDKADSAAVWYRMVIEENADTEVAQRAFYALAEVQRSLGDTLSAHGIYRQVLSDYPDSDFAARVRMELGLAPQETMDSLAVAQQAYEEALLSWRDGAYEEAFRRMVLIASRYRELEAAPKALFAAGRIYFEWAAADSLDVLGPLSVALPDSVLIQAGIMQPPPDTLAAADSLSFESPQLALADSSQAGVAPDSLQADAAPDSLQAGVAPDSLQAGVAPDSLQAGVAPDSLQAGVAPDSLQAGVAADSLQALAAPDSLQAPAAPDPPAPLPLDDEGPPAALLASAAVDIVDLRSVYAGVRALYPDTPYAERAEYILDALDAERQALQDSLNASADSLALPVASDSLHFPADSLAVPVASDSLNVPADSLAVPVVSDSLNARVDSLAAPAASTVPDSLVVEQADAPPGSFDEANPPGETLTFLDETSTPPDEMPAPPDEVPAPADETFPPPGEAPAPPGETAALSEAASAPPLSGIPTGEFSLYGPGGVQAALGGFTIALDAHAEREPMETLIAPYLQQGLRVAVVVDSVNDAAVYLAVLGHFPSEEAAEAGLQGARYMLGDLAQTARVLPLNTP